MLGLRSKAKLLREKLRFGKKNVAEIGEPVPGHALIARTLFAREKAGEITTLRQLHQITQIAQPAALKLLADMERAGDVTVDEALHDIFESTIELSENARVTLRSQPAVDAA